MYSQYQYYQQPTQAISSQQGAMTWNGSSWVSNPSHVAASTYSTYEQPLQHSLIPPKPVETYTEYYHAWIAHGKECEDYLRRLGPGNEGQTAQLQRQIEWAKYYADESSRAAHHFYSNPNATSAPFDLPPAPPKSNTPKQTVAPKPDQQQQQQHQQQYGNHNQKPTPNTETKSSDEHTPGSLTRYVKRCIDQCSTDQQRKAVQAEVEKAIADAIQKGELHTKNWENVPLIPVPGAGKLSFSITPQPAKNSRQQRSMQQQQQQPKHANNSSGSKFDPFSNRSQNNKNSKYSRQYDEKLPENDSYYGHSGGGNSSAGGRNSPSSDFGSNRRGSTQSDTSSISISRRSSAQNDNYYGPASVSSAQNNQSHHSSRKNTSPSSRHNTNSTYVEDSPSLSSQKRVVSPDEDFISFQQRKHKKQKVNGFEKSSHVLAKRANRFSGPGGIQDASNSATTINGHGKYMGKKLIGGSSKTLDEEDFQKMTVKGTCLTLEKEYLRLTAPPKAELVRPQPILELHLENIKQDYAAKKRDYLWFCSQLKAIRQDCTVQRIQCPFTVDVYETHARIALQEGDLNEYNQCQTQLKELYEMGHSMGNENEFIAYRLLYYVFLSTNEKYDGGSSDMFKILLSLTALQREHLSISHALKIRESLACGDYLRFFRLHKESPGLSRYLTDRIAPTMRLRGLKRMVKAYRPSVELDIFESQLGFDSTEDCIEFMKSCGCVIEGPSCITKDSVVHEPIVDKKNSLI